MAGDADRRLEMPVAAPDGRGRNPREYGDGASSLAARTENSYPETSGMMDAVVERENMIAVLRRVKSNKGSAGVDNMSVDALDDFLLEHWPRIKAELLEGRYQPAPARRGEGACLDHPVPGETAQTQGEPGQKRGLSPLEEEISGLQHDEQFDSPA